MARPDDPCSDGDLVLPPGALDATVEAALAATGVGAAGAGPLLSEKGNTWCVTLIWLDQRSARSRQWDSTRRKRGVLKNRASASRLASGRVSRNLESASISRKMGLLLLSPSSGVVEDADDDEEVVEVAVALVAVFGGVGLAAGVSPPGVGVAGVVGVAHGSAQDRGIVQARITSSCCKSSSNSRPEETARLDFNQQAANKSNPFAICAGVPVKPVGSGLWMGPHTSCTLTGRGSAVSRRSCGNWYTRDRSSSTSPSASLSTVSSVATA